MSSLLRTFFQHSFRQQYINKILLLKYLKADVLFPGKPADLYDKTHPDWVLTKNMGHSSSVSKPSSQCALARQKRAKERQCKKRKCLEEVFKEMDCESVALMSKHLQWKKHVHLRALLLPFKLTFLCKT